MTNIAQTLETKAAQAKKTLTMQEIKFDIGRFPLLAADVFLKNYLEGEDGSEKAIPSVLATIENIQSHCIHGPENYSMIGGKKTDIKCGLCGKDLA